ncbi:MAG: hypothetical protein Q7O66_11110, partial [Dehalococcoidia bacterium]|nr:hypothetical protein [Dehalococcoidia bacterium]
MTRIDSLQKKYPDLPREIIIKWDAMNLGITDTEALDTVAFWDRSGSYQSRDQDVTLKEIGEKRPGTVRHGFVMRPGEFYMKNGIGARISRSSRSPYQVRKVASGGLALYEGEDKVENIFFPAPRPPSEEPLTSKGTPITSFIA